MTTTPHLFWITSRAAGSVALVGASLSVVLGILMGKRATGTVRLPDLRAAHEIISLLTLGMIGLHGVALLGDQFLHPGVAGILVPFASSYRPLFTASPTTSAGASAWRGGEASTATALSSGRLASSTPSAGEATPGGPGFWRSRHCPSPPPSSWW